MKKYLFALSALTVMTVAANAQEKNNSTDASGGKHDTYMHHKKPGYGMHAHHHHNMMMKLNLTDAQKQQVKDLNTDYRKQLKDLEKSETITLKDYRAKKAALEQERKSKFQSILTSDQKNKIVQAKKERGEKMKVMAQKRLEKMKTDLNLTDEQVAKIKEQRNNSIEQAKAIRENSSLTKEQKKEQFMSLMKNRKESINSISYPGAGKEKRRNERQQD